MVRRGAWLVALVLSGLLPAGAQNDRPRGELFAGYSHARIKGVGFPTRQSANGWAANLTINVHEHFGFTAEFARQYGHVPVLRVCQAAQPCQARFASHQLLLGPRFAVRTRLFTPFAHALVGLFNTEVSSIAYLLRPPPLPPPVATIPGSSETDFAMAFGGGLDVNLTRRVAWRLLQADYLAVRSFGPTRFFGAPQPERFWQHNLRIESGFVLKFGSSRRRK
jgi:hypothetical protein